MERGAPDCETDEKCGIGNIVPRFPEEAAVDISKFLNRISVGEPPDWVTVREAGEPIREGTKEPVSLLLMDRQYHAEKHGMYQHTVRHLDTMQEVQQSSQWQLAFDPATQSVSIHGIRIRRDGRIVEHAQPARFRLLQREENLERLVLDGSVTLVVLLEDVRVGDVLDASFTIETSPRLFAGRFSLLASAPETIAVGEFSVSVRFAAGSPMSWQSSNKNFCPVIREVGTEVEWRWKLENIHPLVPEPWVPAWHLPAWWLQISDCSSWAEVAKEFHAAWCGGTEDAELDRMLGEISASTPDPAARADRVITLLQDEIRYLSVNTELGGQIPSPPALVFQRRFGDCKDKSFLLAQLLCKLGIPAYPVLVGSSLRQAIERLLPMSGVFDHCIVGYTIDGRQRWVDPTIPFQGGGALGRQLPDFGCGLPVHPESAGIEAIPVESRRQDRYRLQETFRPDTAGGTSVLEVIVSTTGLCADDLRRSVLLEGADQVSRNREEIYRRRYPEISRIGAMQWNDNRASNEFTIAETFEIPNLLVPYQGRPAFAFQFDAHLIQSVLALPGGTTRKFPFEFSRARRIEHWIDVDTPNIAHQNVEQQLIRAGAFQFSREAKRSAIHFNLDTHTDVVMPVDFESHRKDVEKVCANLSIIWTLPAGVPVSRMGRRPSSLAHSASQGALSSAVRSGTAFKPLMRGRKPGPVRASGTDQSTASAGPLAKNSRNESILSGGKAMAWLPPSATSKKSDPKFPRTAPEKHFVWRPDGQVRRRPDRAQTMQIWQALALGLLLIVTAVVIFFVFR